MSYSETITRNDLTNILNEALPPTASEYRKLLWTNPNIMADFAAQTILLDLSDYDEVEVWFTIWKSDKRVNAIFRAEKNYSTMAHGMASSSTSYDTTTNINNAPMTGTPDPTERAFYFTNTGVVFGEAREGMNGFSTTNNNILIPYKIYGIKYERVNPPQEEIADVIVEQGTSGIWTYRKWNSGIAECWGINSASVTCSVISSPWIRGSMNNINFPSSLFNDTPLVMLTGFNAEWVSLASHSKDAISTIYIYTVATGTSTRSVRIHAIGTWK